MKTQLNVATYSQKYKNKIMESMTCVRMKTIVDFCFWEIPPILIVANHVAF